MSPTAPMPTPAEVLAKQKQLWEEAAAGWERWSDWFEGQVQPLTAAMLEGAGLASGMTVLDLACGPGGFAAQVAARVRPGGRVIATDLSPRMVGATRQRARRLAIDDLEAREMDAQALAFGDAEFGAVTGRFGLMLCPDPARAAAEAQRVLAPGGRCALAAWDEPSKNPVTGTMMEVLERYVPVPAFDPTQPGPFRLSPPGEFDRLLRAAGFRDITVEPFPIAWRYASPEEFWRIQRDMSGPLRTAAATLEPGDLARLEADLTHAIARFIVGGEVRIAMTPLLALATR